jgi:hypothetical protein
MIWWRLKTHPEDRYQVIKLIVPIIREHTLPLAWVYDREICERALRAAEICADAPTAENRKAAADAADAAYAACAAYAAYADAAACAAAAACADAYAAAADAAYAAAADAVREKIRSIWCVAIRSRWPESPWQ